MKLNVVVTKNFLIIKLINIYCFLFLLLSVKCTAQTSPCPQANKYTKKMLKKVLTEDKNENLQDKARIENITMQDVRVLKYPTDTNACKALKKDGFHYPKDPDIPTTLTYFKSGNFFFAVVHFSDRIIKIKNGKIKGNSGPPGDIKIYDKNFHVVADQIIW